MNPKDFYLKVFSLVMSRPDWASYVGDKAPQAQAEIVANNIFSRFFEPVGSGRLWTGDTAPGKPINTLGNSADLASSYRLRKRYQALDLTPDMAVSLYYRMGDRGIGQEVHGPIVFEVPVNIVKALPDGPGIEYMKSEAKKYAMAMTPDEVSDRSFVYMINWLCHAGIENANANGDYFEGDDLIDAVYGAQFSPEHPAVLDVNHQMLPAAGITIDARYGFDDAANAFGIQVLSTIFAWGPYERMAKDIVQSANDGTMKMSMMCVPEYVSCSECGAIANDPDRYCVHLQNRGQYPGVKRGLRHPVFYANSLIFKPYQPADQMARPTWLGMENKPTVQATVTVGDISGGEEMTLEQALAEIEKLKADLKEANDKLAAATAGKESAEAKVKEAQEALAQVKESDATELKSVTDTLAKAQEDLKLANDALTKANSDLKAASDELSVYKKNETEAKVSARVAEAKSLFEATDAEVVQLKAKAESSTDEEWGQFVTFLKKAAGASVGDVHVEATEATRGVGAQRATPRPQSKLPNISKVLSEQYGGSK